jgi:hypothetical protein
LSDATGQSNWLIAKKKKKEKNLRDTPSDYGMAQKVVIA